MNLNIFFTSTLAELQKHEKHLYYIYCLVELKHNQAFYIEKGKNRVFVHHQAVLDMLRKYDLLEENETARTLKIRTIREINRMNVKLHTQRGAN
ncbi:hypothetical protein P7H50_06220 [Enterococcus durans]|nr:hypothetical protein [Enterococcus durans]